MSFTLTTPSKVKYRTIKGISGVEHKVAIVNVEGKDYILINCKGLISEEFKLEITKMVIISMDVGIPPLLIVNNSENILKEIEGIIRRLGGKIVKAD